MRFSIFYCLLFMLISISCKHTPEHPESTTPERPLLEEELSLSCIDTYIIYEETAMMWEKSWASVFGNGETSPVVPFPNDQLEQLKRLSRNQFGVRIYYILINEDETTPSLAMVNTEDCDTDQQCGENATCFLVSQIIGKETKQFFTTKDSLDIYKERWSTYSKSNLILMHTPVEGYNYSWNKLDSLMSDSETSGNTDPGINISYGLHTLGPLDTELFTGSVSTDVTGSIVYANVMSPNTSNKSLSLDSDFAMPCPAYCNNGLE